MDPPDRLEDLRHTADYLFGAVCPERGAAFGLVLPVVRADAMQPLIDQRGQVASGAHVLLFLARAGWHCANDLVIPENSKAAFLPPYSTEPNAIEQHWLHLKERFLSHSLWPDYDVSVDAVCQARQRVTSDTGRIEYLCSMKWAEAVRKLCGWYNRGWPPAVLHQGRVLTINLNRSDKR